MAVKKTTNDKVTASSDKKSTKTQGKARTKSTQGKDFKYGITEAQADELVLALMENNFNISKACEVTGILRKAYYYNLKWSKDFKDRIDWGKSFLKHVVENGVLEGLTHSDLTLRYKYLDLLAKSGILAKVLGFEDETNEVVLKFNKDDIELK
jgi:hypothetical protein